METEILEILSNTKKQNNMYIYNVSGIFDKLKNKAGGRKACARAANRLVKKGLIRSSIWYNGEITFSAI